MLPKAQFKAYARVFEMISEKLEGRFVSRKGVGVYGKFTGLRSAGISPHTATVCFQTHA
jgi:hypothetical protein